MTLSTLAAVTALLLANPASTLPERARDPHEGLACCAHHPGPGQDKSEGSEAEKLAKARAKFEQELLNDIKIGKEAADEYDRRLPATKNAESQAKIEAIGQRLALIANSTGFEVLWGERRLSTFDYRFRVVESPDINAFSLPGGYIYVFQGLVDFCQSDDELASVLAHEIMHAHQRHIAWMQREQSKMAPIQIPLILASIFTGSGAGLTATNLAGTALTNGWSQRAEYSADYGGVQLMVAGGYDATGALTFMERLQLKDGIAERATDLGIFRTHPPSKDRAARIEGYMRRQLIPIRRSLVSSTFRVTVNRDGDKQVLMYGRRKLMVLPGATSEARAQKMVKTLNDFFDAVPEMYEVQPGEDGVIFGKNKVLLTLTEEDAAANGVPLDELQQRLSKSIRGCIFSLAYHIWESRGG